MEPVFFVLNNSLSVDTSRNLLTHHPTGLETKLEPRLIQLLQILAQNQGKLVSREQLISEIWDNYGGVEDGLHQGISFLRKAIADSNKQIIETVPKKGYILHATVTNSIEEEKITPPITNPSKKRATIIAVAGGVLTLIALLVFIPKHTDKPNKFQQQPPSLTPVDSIVTKNWHGKFYKLIVGNGQQVVLFENNIQVPTDSLVHYEMVIQELKDKFTSEQDARR